MPRLSTSERAVILAVLAEGNSVASTARITGADKEAILKLLIDVSAICRSVHNRLVRGLRCRLIEADEIWSFVHTKQKRVKPEEIEKGYGDAWLWLATDIDTKLIVSYLVGDRGSESAHVFMEDLAARLTHRVQINTDGLLAYVDAVGHNFDNKVDLVHGKKAIIGNPDSSATVSTSHAERLNLTIRMQDRRFTRKTNGFSKKYANHCASVDFHVVYYNFIRVHMSLDVTPAMEAGIAKNIWTYADLVRMLEAKEQELLDAPITKFRSLVKSSKLQP